jgi:hypothetical protein
LINSNNLSIKRHQSELIDLIWLVRIVVFWLQSSAMRFCGNAKLLCFISQELRPLHNRSKTF